MELYACLGVGPGHRLLLGPATHTHAYAAAGGPAPPAVPVRILGREVEQPARRSRTKRGAAETRNLYERVKAAVEAGIKAGRDPFVVRDEIARNEDVQRSYVDHMVCKMGLAGKRRTSAEIRELVARAFDLMAEHDDWSKARVAHELGVSEPYLYMVMSRHTPEQVPA